MDKRLSPPLQGPLPPTGPPPPGGDQSQAAKLITIWAVLISLSVVVVTVRFIARAVGRKHIGWDDWTMLAALVSSLLTRTQQFSQTIY